jgi:Delta7-sterol 5-desaturase
MDLVLELFDTYLFDYMYAFVLPAHHPHPALKNSTATFSSMREGPTPSQYVFHPASEYLSFPPSDWAYKSVWARDDIYRQAVSLFLITWYESRLPSFLLSH